MTDVHKDMMKYLTIIGMLFFCCATNATETKGPTPTEVKQMHVIDQKYKDYRHFVLFTMSVHDGANQNPTLRVYADIINATKRHAPQEPTPDQKKLSAQPFFDHVDVYFNNDQKTAKTHIDLAALKNSNDEARQIKQTVDDGEVVDTFELNLPDTVVAMLQAEKPETVRMVFLDKDDKVVDVTNEMRVPDVSQVKSK